MFDSKKTRGEAASLQRSDARGLTLAISGLVPRGLPSTEEKGDS